MSQSSPSGRKTWRVSNLLRPSTNKAQAEDAQQTGVEMTQPSHSLGVQQTDSTSSFQRAGCSGQAAPLPMPQPGVKQQPPARCESAGLPSALGTPPRPAGSLGGGHEGVCAQVPDAAFPSSSGEQQQQEGWQLPAAPRPGSSPLAAASAANGAPPANQQGDGTPAVAQQGGYSGSTSTSSSRGVLPGGPRAGRAASLPASDDPQLNSYLSYLLKEQHPHNQLYYPGWGLSESGCAAIGEFLRRDKRIKVVTLSGNAISDEGVAAIAGGLACNSTVLSLDLSDNDISSVGALDLAEALHSDKCKVAQLLLHNNRIGDDGADALAAAIASSPCLKKLKLTGNSVTAAQLEVVQHVLKTREYRLSALRATSRGKRHLRKDSSVLQFDIELSEAPRNSSSTGNLTRKSLRLPAALTVAALVEAKDPLESSIGMQAAHLLAELQEKARQGAADASAAAAAAAPSDAANGQQQGPASSSSCPGSELSLAVMLAVRLACRGYDVHLRTCFPCLEQEGQQPAASEHLLAGGLRHTFVRVSQPVPADEAVVLPTVIVDPSFADQFQMPHPTPRLQEALEALPRVLCLAEARLFHLVDLLCVESAAAFQQAKLSLPPWRSTPMVMDKWLSTQFHDVAVEADSSPQELEQAIAHCAAASHTSQPP